MDINKYFERINYTGTPRVDFDTLASIQHQHLLNIPYENIDVQLGTPLDFDIERIFEKLVMRNRGGWCYEMNGLLAWALSEIGFDVKRMSGAVMRSSKGDSQLGNHLVLEVVLDKSYMVDVGLGDGLRWPIPIELGNYEQNGLGFSLEQLSDGYLRFHNHEFSSVDSFDFKHAVANENELQLMCQQLQTDPLSPFKMLLIVQRFTPDDIFVQIGKVSHVINAEGKSTKVLDSVSDLHEQLHQQFNLDVDLTEIWPRICVAHDKIFGAA